MEKFSGLLNSPFQFTDCYEELPGFLLEQIGKVLQVDIKAEGFVASCWVETMLMKGKVFILVTRQRVAYSDTVRVNQNLFADMTGVERNMLKNVKLLSPGNATILFPSTVSPTLKLMDRMFEVISKQWIASRQAGPVVQPVTVDIAAQIQQLGGLRDKGLLTEEEFSAKKKELLAKM